MWWLVWFLFGGFVATTVFALSGKARKWAAGIDDKIDDEVWSANAEARAAEIRAELARIVGGEKKA